MARIADRWASGMFTVASWQIWHLTTCCSRLLDISIMAWQTRQVTIGAPPWGCWYDGGTSAGPIGETVAWSSTPSLNAVSGGEWVKVEQIDASIFRVSQYNWASINWWKRNNVTTAGVSSQLTIKQEERQCQILGFPFRVRWRKKIGIVCFENECYLSNCHWFSNKCFSHSFNCAITPICIWCIHARPVRE